MRDVPSGLSSLRTDAKADNAACAATRESNRLAFFQDGQSPEARHATVCVVFFRLLAFHRDVKSDCAVTISARDCFH